MAWSACSSLTIASMQPSFLDEEAGSRDQIAYRDPCTAIRPEDDDLIRALAAVAPSKLLITSRLAPRVLLNPAGQPIPGVLHERLPGLRPADAAVFTPGLWCYGQFAETFRIT